MNKVEKIIFIILSIFLLLLSNVFAKYNYKFTLNAYQFSYNSPEIENTSNIIEGKLVD